MDHHLNKKQKSLQQTRHPMNRRERFYKYFFKVLTTQTTSLQYPIQEYANSQKTQQSTINKLLSVENSNLAKYPVKERKIRTELKQNEPALADKVTRYEEDKKAENDIVLTVTEEKENELDLVGNISFPEIEINNQKVEMTESKEEHTWTKSTEQQQKTEEVHSHKETTAEKKDASKLIIPMQNVKSIRFYE